MVDKRHYKAGKDAELRKKVIGTIKSRKDVHFVSVETTGLDPMKDRVMSVHITKAEVTEDRTFEKKEDKVFLMKIDGVIPENIVRISGISNEMLKDAKEPKEVMAEAYDFLGDRPVIIGWNTESFTIPFLKNAGFYSGYMIDPGLVIDLMEVSKMLLPQTNSFKSYSMKTVAAQLDIALAANKNDTYMNIANELFLLVPMGSGSAKITNSSYWTKGYHSRFIFFETSCGNVGIDCGTGYWIEKTSGAFDAIDLDAMTAFICKKYNARSIWEFMKLYLAENEQKQKNEQNS